MKSPEVSIVIPAYNEEARLPRALARIRDYLASRGMGAEHAEIIVVDDGSRDATAQYSVRHGMLEARGRIALFTDADLSAPIEEADKLFAALKAGNDVTIGSRALDRSLISTHQSRLRELAGIIFNSFVRLFTGLPFHDTQCGFKAFLRESTRIVFEQQRIERFGFDPEILFLAKRHGLRAAEIPVRWAHDPATKVHVVRDSLLMFSDLVVIRWNWLRGRYPRQPAAR